MPKKRRSEMSPDELLDARIKANIYYHGPRHEEFKARGRRYYAEKPKQNQESSLRKRFGVTVAIWEDWFEWQGSACASCGLTEGVGRKAWHMDHSHETGTLRGLLCRECNLKLGRLGDNATEVLRICLRLLAYLQQSGDVPQEPELVDMAMSMLEQFRAQGTRHEASEAANDERLTATDAEPEAA